ncbi:putative viral replicase p1 [Ilarvirus APLPV]|uniref:Replication protein 1a n=1 Tax=Ilarvirus APLPV TaxID=134632 RepID=Q997A4_9BROM|nr:putative viral replicase p1 [American plum line pattern virus]AAK15026.1 putative viral replicase p1 [American plum line pattern virus]
MTCDAQTTEISELLDAVLKARCADESSTVGKVFADYAAQKVRNSLGDSKVRRPLTVSFQLTPDQQALLRHNFPGREIRFSSSAPSSHSFAAAHRILETDFLYDCLSSEAPVIDLGGNFSTHLKNKRHNVHCCCPLLDYRDGARHTERIYSWDKYSKHNRGYDRTLVLSEYVSRVYRSADYAMAVHSTSDIPLVELCSALRCHGVRKFVCTMMMTPEMLFQSSGYIPHFEVRWTVDKKADRIFFDFENAPNLGMTILHSDQLFPGELCRPGRSRLSCGKTQDGGVVVIDITYVDGYYWGLSLEGGRSCAWFSRIRDKVLVNTVSDFDPYSNDVVRKEVLMDREVLTRVVEAAFRQYKPTTAMETAVQSIAMLLSSSTNHVIVNGVTMIAGTPLEIYEYVPVAVAVYKHVRHYYNMVSTIFDLINSEVQVKTSVPRFDSSAVPTVDMWGDAAMIEGAMEEVEISPSFIGSLFREQLISESDYERVVRLPGVSLKRWWEEFRAKHLGTKRSFLRIFSDPEFCIPFYDYVVANHGSFLQIFKQKDVEMGDLAKERKQSRELLRKSIREEEERKEAEERRLSKAVIRIAQWLEAHPNGKIPSGLGDIKDFLPVIHAKSEVNEGVKEGVVLNPYAENITEAIEYLDSVFTIQRRTMDSIINHCEGGRVISPAVFAGFEDLRIFKPSSNRWYAPSGKLPQAEEQYSFGYVVGGDRVTIHWAGGEFSVDTRKALSVYSAVFFDKSCVVDTSGPIRESLRGALTRDTNVEITLIDGVAGCGKTTKIVKSADIDREGGCLILTSNRNSAEELRSKVRGSQLVKSRVIRTVDSYLMAKNPPTADVVYFDECFLQHSGVILAAVTLAKAKKLYAFGDTEQIPFISRNPLFRFKHRFLTSNRRIECLDTFRSPADATFLLGKYFYKKKSQIKTTSRVQPSISVKPISVHDQIEVDKSAIYCCYIQAEKAELLSKPQFKNMEVATIHEKQGESVDKVIFFRLSKTSTELTTGKHPVMGPCHALVALSRHKKEFVYYTRAATVDTSDCLYKACMDVPETKELYEVFTPSERSSLVLD